MNTGPNEYILLLGSNLGNPLAMIRKASSLIKDRAGEIFTSSKVYSSEPWGFESQDRFLNQALLIRSELAPKQLLEQIHIIESDMGRQRHSEGGYSSRSIDIDILHWNKAEVRDPELVIPHPLIHERRFVLVPLCEIAGNLKHTIFNVTYDELLAQCIDNGAVVEETLPNE